MQVPNATLNATRVLPSSLLANEAKPVKDGEPTAENRARAHGVMRSIMNQVGQGAAPANDAAAPPEPGTLNVDELMGAWGSSDPQYDLNGDGTVNVLDLLSLLASMSSPPEEPQPDSATVTDATAGDPAAAPELTIDGLMNAWGTDDPNYDLNGDGTVDVQDLLTMLERMGDGTAGGSATGLAAVETDPNGATSPPNEPLTMEGLLAAWGETDSPYDINGNGVVNVQDLLLLLAKMSNGNQNEPATIASAARTDDTAASTPADPNAPLTIDGLKAAWGESDSRYDLNGDGTVNVQDLLTLLEKMSNAGASGPAPAVVAEGNGAEVAALPSEPPAPPLSLQAILKNWGGNDPRYDVNGDGTINVQDLLAFLAKQSGQHAVTEANAASTDPRPIARTLMAKLDAAGFGAQPPSNLHEIVDRLKLPAGHQKTLMEALAARYPDGLGVNVVT